MMTIITMHLLQTDDAKLCLLTSLSESPSLSHHIYKIRNTRQQNYNTAKSSTIGRLQKVLTSLAIHAAPKNKAVMNG
jgi:hypothetical protein